MRNPDQRAILIVIALAIVATLLFWSIPRTPRQQHGSNVLPGDAARAQQASDGGDAYTAAQAGAGNPRAVSAIDLFKRKVKTLSDPEWNMALTAWANQRPEFVPWVLDDEKAFANASRAALHDDPEATFERLMPKVAERMRARPSATGRDPAPPTNTITPLPAASE